MTLFCRGRYDSRLVYLKMFEARGNWGAARGAYQYRWLRGTTHAESMTAIQHAIQRPLQAHRTLVELGHFFLHFFT